MRGASYFLYFSENRCSFRYFLRENAKKVKKSLEGKKKSLSLQPVSEITGKFIDNIERLVQQVPRTKMRALILFLGKMNKLSGSNLRDKVYIQRRV